MKTPRIFLLHLFQLLAQCLEHNWEKERKRERRRKGRKEQERKKEKRKKGEREDK